MPSLSGKSTNGTPNWDKYVVNNNYEQVTYTIETQALFFKKQTNNKAEHVWAQLAPGTKLSITNSRTVNISASRDTGVTRALTSQPAASVQIGNKKGYVLINKIKKPTKAPDSVEKRTISMAQTDLDNLKSKAGVGKKRVSGVDIEVDGFGLITDVATVEKVPERVNGREAKADIVLKNSKGTRLIYISHKAAGGAKAFQQYGGISETAGTKEMPALVYNNPEVQKFLNDLYSLYQSSLDGTGNKMNPFEKGKLKEARLYRPITDTQLINQSVFGPGFGGPSGIDNVDVIAQGPFKFKPVMNPYGDIIITLSWDHFDYRGGDINEFNSGKYQALLVSRSASDRRTKTPQGDIPGVRTGIFNRSYLSGQSMPIDVAL